MKFSRKTQYGLRAMIHMAEASGKEKKICSIKEISDEEEIPFDYLEKVVSRLEKKGLVESKLGAKGGYFLSRSPKKISVGEVARALERTTTVVRCLSSSSKEKYNCPLRKRCRAIEAWAKIQDALNSALDSVMLKDLIS
jgi:Rrf2 family cysteine metabolism transcriptional repressor